jgi:putative transposase
LLTDGNGIPLAIAVAGANRPDYQLAQETLAAIVVSRPTPTPSEPQGLCLDAGYDYVEIYDLLETLGYTEHIRPRGGEPKVKDPTKKARRWVVERTHSWLNRYRALLIRWCKQADYYRGQLQLACALIILKQAGLLG